MGIPKLVRGDWVKKGAIVIDVGINNNLHPFAYIFLLATELF